MESEDSSLLSLSDPNTTLDQTKYQDTASSRYGESGKLKSYSSASNYAPSLASRILLILI